MSDKAGDLLLIAGLFTAIFGWLKLRALPKGKVIIGMPELFDAQGRPIADPPRALPGMEQKPV
ncbi:MAG: hypothetical protein ACK4OG_06685, partial [Parvibaculum sp.]